MDRRRRGGLDRGGGELGQRGTSLSVRWGGRLCRRACQVSNQNGYGAMSPRTVTHWVSVKASRLAWLPPCRDPVPESLRPPNGALGSSLTVWSLMCTSPVGM